jgi:hypothetical protein
MNVARKHRGFVIETDTESVSSSGNFVGLFTPANSTTPPHMSNYSFSHYLPRRPLTASAYASPHSLDDTPVFQHRPKSRNFLDFSKQHRPSTVELIKSHNFGPGHYSPQPISRKSSIPNFSRQISREKANFRSKRDIFVVQDRSLSRTCSLTLPRRRCTIFYPPREAAQSSHRQSTHRSRPSLMTPIEPP